ncbi:3-isopropylmalate dehydrogenase [Defluviimonas salinarum]|uniref:3-isopropylmalate dehydrogenase n=1 Tax=Defluviimonas salinarum TaxID=2992147 RepID=A0ABT3J752_9RHOB|nr:3-isopropylmalate dehydrogenase [Defluviimonas salinarum]MCW3783295.1 3-isopropylmalate dehydrogenase [Defluviimonas salinarum]
MADFSILALGGDGIGPEVLAAALDVTEVASGLAGIRLDIAEDLLHGAAWEAHGTFCREETVTAARAADAVLVGAVGGPEWDDIRVPGGPEMQDGLMRLRKALDAYAGLRPARAWPELGRFTPFRAGLAERADIMVLREMTGGVMFASPRGQERRAGRRYGFDTAAYDEGEIARIAHSGFRLARTRKGRLVSADKANVMESYKLWRAVVTEVAAEYPDVTLTHMYADNCAFQMMRTPLSFDVVMGCNLIGDFLSDLAAVVSGSLGLLPSACLCGSPGGRVKGIYEPVHGSAPDIAGQGIANPAGTILSVAMMFEHSLALPAVARRIEAAVERALVSGHLTPDLGGTATTRGFADAVTAELRA